MNSTKFIFVTGGNLSSLGKGLSAAAMAKLVKMTGCSVTIMKCDPYLNLDPGTLNPYEHGECFVTNDGMETDLDLGHYERFLNQDMERHNSITTGQVYTSVLENERKGKYLGKTVQVIPHITDEIKERIKYFDGKFEYVFVEIGGTVGDIESIPFLEAIRQMRNDLGRERTCFIHLTYLPVINHNETKTKLAQHSVKTLMEYGIQPDFLVCRVMEKWNVSNSEELSIKEKLANFCNVNKQRILMNLNVESIYDLVVSYNNQHFVTQIFDYFRSPGLKGEYILSDSDVYDVLSSAIPNWKSSTRQKNSNEPINVVIAGKYVRVGDAYISVIEAIKHAASRLDVCVKIKLIDTEEVDERMLEDLEMDACIIPGGFGNRGIEGMIDVSQYCRTHKIPCLGICLGMQIMAVEFARHELDLPQATSSEWNPNASDENKVIINMSEFTGDEQMGGTMRLGSYKNEITNDRLSSIYLTGTDRQIEERHRHRYEFNYEKFNERFEEKGMNILAEYYGTDEFFNSYILAESIGIDNTAVHPFYIGCQFHPELKSRPERPHPLFMELLGQTEKVKKSRLL